MQGCHGGLRFSLCVVHQKNFSLGKVKVAVDFVEPRATLVQEGHSSRNISYAGLSYVKLFEVDSKNITLLLLARSKINESFLCNTHHT